MVPWLREDEALLLHQALLEDSLRLVRAGASESGATPFVSFSESWNPRDRPGCENIDRAAAGMARRRLIERRFHRVVVIGSDSPTLPPAMLSAAFTSLERDVDVVLGPAEDGGYYLVGATRLLPTMFDSIPWGTDGVLRTTLAALACGGARVVVLSPWYDIDMPQDLERARRDFAGFPPGVPAPASTRAFVDALVRDGRLPYPAL
jgi:glycosyltransferase A (GT-A) superfamily protein (DUF2064 family)